MVNKIDSNVTGLSFAEEIAAKQLPGSPIWYELEPNSYDDFGGELTTLARNPINASRQRKKGVVVDLDASSGFNQDYTQNNFNRLLQGFFFADMREKASTKPLNDEQVIVTGATTGTNVITAASGLGVFRVNDLVFVSGFNLPNNNGLFTVTASSDTSLTLSGTLSTEIATDVVVIRTVGRVLGAATAELNVTSGIPTLHLTSAPTAASATVTVSSGENVSDGDTVTIGDVVYTFATTPTDPFDLPLGVDDDASAANLATAINGGLLDTPAHLLVTAQAVANVVTLTARTKGTLSNGIVVSVDGDELTASGNLTGGTGFSLFSLNLIIGEWLFLGGDSAGTYFPDNRGYVRVASITDTDIRFDKTTFTPTSVAATGISLQVFCGDVIKNERELDLVKTRYYQFERTLGQDEDGTQAEYISGSVLNELTLNGAVADKLNADVSILSADNEQRSGAEGLKAGTRVKSLGEDAYNTSSDVYRLMMTVIDPASTIPTSLFSYVSEFSLTINNNVSPVKAISVLGNLDVSVGTFEVGGEVTAFFTSVAATKAVRDNADVTFDAIFAKNNKGFIYDIPLLSLGGGRLEVTAGEPITVPLEQLAAENIAGYTLSKTIFGYLPNAAMPD